MMSRGRFGNSSDSWAVPAAAHAGQPSRDYWINYLPLDDHLHLPPTSDLRGSGRMRSFQDRWTGGRGSIFGLPSLPSVPVSGRPSVRLLLIDDDYMAYGPAQGLTPPTPPTYYEWPREDHDSKLSEEEQKQALNKLRKQLYSPHMSSIVSRLGTGSSKSSGGNSLQHADHVKSCAVCLDDFKTRQFVTVTPCNHMFHEECIVPWVKSQGKCPVCRFVITPSHNQNSTTSGHTAVVAPASTRARIPRRF